MAAAVATAGASPLPQPPSRPPLAGLRSRRRQVAAERLAPAARHRPLEPLAITAPAVRQDAAAAVVAGRQPQPLLEPLAEPVAMPVVAVVAEATVLPPVPIPGESVAMAGAAKSGSIRGDTWLTHSNR